MADPQDKSGSAGWLNEEWVNRLASSIELMTAQMVNKILHYPILQLKEADEPQEQRESIRKTIRKIFGLR